MSSTTLRVVLDTNVLLRAALSPASYSGQILKACEQRSLIMLLSRAAIHEYRAVLGELSLAEKYSRLREINIEMLLTHLRYIGDYYHPVRKVFSLPRDPKDERWLDLALCGRATHLITTDLDMLSLPDDRSQAGKRFRQMLRGVQTLEPRDFVRLHPDQVIS